MTKNQNLPRFSHLRVGDLAIFHQDTGDVPVKVAEIVDGNTARVVATASRTGAEKGQSLAVTDNLTSQRLTTRTKSQSTLLVF